MLLLRDLRPGRTHNKKNLRIPNRILRKPKRLGRIQTNLLREKMLMRPKKIKIKKWFPRCRPPIESTSLQPLGTFNIQNHLKINLKNLSIPIRCTYLIIQVWKSVDNKSSMLIFPIRLTDQFIGAAQRHDNAGEGDQQEL